MSNLETRNDTLEKLLRNPQFLPDVFETMRDGLMVVDIDGNILLFNKAAEQITGYRKEDVIGKECTVLDSDTCVVYTEEGKQRKCELFEKGSVCNKKCRIRSVDGRSVYLLKNAVVLRDSNGEIV